MIPDRQRIDDAMQYRNSLLIYAIISGLLLTCGTEDTGHQVITVGGSIPAPEMGVTLIHEHVLVDWIGADSTGYHRWDREEVVERVLPYFLELRDRGVHTVIECTPAYLGRDPFILQDLSRRSGIQILTNTGYYGAVDNVFMPAHAYHESSGEIARRWTDEFQNGIDGSEVRPGFMKISVGEERPLSEHHKKIVRAAAQTHLNTGMTIVSHTIGDEPAMEQVRLLEAEGVSVSAWVWTHAQSGSREGNIRIADMGGWISLDGVQHSPDHEPGGSGSIEWYAGRIMALRDAGHLDRVLISHDAGWYDAGEPDGGDFRAYTDIFDYLIPELLNNGITEQEIKTIMVHNPERAYAISVR